MNNTCPSCGSVYGVTPQHVGRQFACRKCGAALAVNEEGLQLAGGAAAPPAEEEGAGDTDVDTARVAPRSRRGRGAGGGFGDYLAFRKMIVPILIQVIFWAGTALFIIGGLFQVITGFRVGLSIGFVAVLGGLAMILLGPLAVRIYCEILIVIFRINDTLTDIKNLLEKK